MECTGWPKKKDTETVFWDGILIEFIPNRICAVSVSFFWATLYVDFYQILYFEYFPIIIGYRKKTDLAV